MIVAPHANAGDDQIADQEEKQDRQRAAARSEGHQTGQRGRGLDHAADPAGDRGEILPGAKTQHLCHGIDRPNVVVDRSKAMLLDSFPTRDSGCVISSGRSTRSAPLTFKFPPSMSIIRAIVRPPSVGDRCCPAPSRSPNTIACCRTRQLEGSVDLAVDERAGAVLRRDLPHAGFAARSKYTSPSRRGCGPSPRDCRPSSPLSLALFSNSL